MEKDKIKNEKNDKNDKNDKKDKKDNKNQNVKKEEQKKIEQQKDINKDKGKDNKDNKIDKKKQKKENKIFYSPYGYIKIDKSEMEKNESIVKFVQFRPAPFKIEDCIVGTISTSNLIKEINIKIKTFYNERAIHIIEKIDIFSSLQLVVQRMFEQIKKEKEKKLIDKKEEKKEEKKE